MSLILVACSAGESGEADDDVVLGRVTNDHPAVGYLAGRIRVNGRPTRPEAYCTATLVSPTLVLTAAHCVAPGFERNLEDQARGEDPDADARFEGLEFGLERVGERRVEVRSWTSHQKYESTFVERGGRPDMKVQHDLALLRLSVPVTHIVPARIDFSTVSDTQCRLTAVGYGDTGSGRGSTRAKSLSLCAIGRNPEGLLLTQAKKGSTCFGDSGGPLFGARGLVGVLAMGGGGPLPGGCGTGAKGYYVPLDVEREFLREVSP